jgi:choline dehydrogenase-like flavoprotein
MGTGRLTLFSDTIVRHLASDREGNAIAAYVIDRESHREFKICGGMFFLCASTLESTRILLNSGSAAHPAGLGNSSGALGHYLLDHLSGISLTAQFRYSGDTGENGSRPVQLLYVPRFHNLSHDRSEDFLRGYGWQVTAMRIDDYSPDSGPGCGAGATKPQSETRRKLSDAYVLRMQAFGEMLPRFENYVEIDPAGLRDAWGIPALRIHCAHGANEKAMARHMIASAYAFADALGASVISCNKTLSEPGLSVHEAGTCRMGSDPKNSVLNRFNQCHDAPNVFVTDGSSFTSQGTQNPTLTMMALTARACDYAVQQARRNDLKRRPKHRSQ